LKEKIKLAGAFAVLVKLALARRSMIAGALRLRVLLLVVVAVVVVRVFDDGGKAAEFCR